MYYVIVRNDGQYAAVPGQESSYTPKLEKARTFWTIEAAKKECCPENESPCAVSWLLQRPLERPTIDSDKP